MPKSSSLDGSICARQESHRRVAASTHEAVNRTKLARFALSTPGIALAASPSGAVGWLRRGAAIVMC
jgi:hypothetical protein